MTRRPIQPGIHAGPAEPGDQADAALREAFAAWASGVTLVAVRDDAGVHALTVSAFLPLSLRPPLVAVALSGDAPVLTALLDAGRFTVNVLAASQRALATRFADRFPVGPAPFEPEGDPVLEGAAAAFVCSLESHDQAGDHSLVIGRVERAVVGEETAALAYHRREYRRAE